MFPTQSKVNRTSRLWLLPVVALALLLVGYAVFAASTAQAQTPVGEICIEGIVIDWEENPLAGWQITLTADITDFTPISTVSASAPESDDPEYKDKKKAQKYPYDYPEKDPDFEKGEFDFTESEIDAATIGAPFYGPYTVTIETREGWEGVTPTSLSVNLDVDNDDCVRIRFKMRRIVRVEAYKIDVYHDPLEDWIITAIPGPGNLFASPQEEETSATMTTTVEVTTTTGVTNVVIITGGQAVFTLTPGLWIFTERAPKQDMDEAPNAYVPVVPPNGRQELLIPDDLDPADEPLRVVFKNELVTGCFYVEKRALTNDVSVLGPDYTVAGWGFKLLRTDGSVARQGVTDALGRLRFDNLPFGPYELVEEDRPGWNEVTPRRWDVDVVDNFCDDEEPLVAVFFNEQDNSGFCIEGRKEDANGGYGLPDWEITIEPLDEGAYDPSNVFTNDEGDFTVDFPIYDYRVPGATYEVCELEQDGWLPHTPTCQTVRLPEWPSACVQLDPFVNQQVGHSESEDHGKPDKGHEPDKGDNGKGDNGKGENGNGNGEYDNGGEPRKGEEHAKGEQPGQSYERDAAKGGESHGGDTKCESYHEVKAGEGLYDIGAQYKVSPQAMLDANPDVRNGDELWVYVGQRICIP